MVTELADEIVEVGEGSARAELALPETARSVYACMHA